MTGLLGVVTAGVMASVLQPERAVPAEFVLTTVQQVYATTPITERLTLTVHSGSDVRAPRVGRATYTLSLHPGTRREMTDAWLLLDLDTLDVRAIDGTVSITRPESAGLVYRTTYGGALTPDVMDAALPPLCLPQLALAQAHVDPSHWDLTPYTPDVTWAAEAQAVDGGFRVDGTFEGGTISLTVSGSSRFERLVATYGEPPMSPTTIDLRSTAQGARAIGPVDPDLLEVGSLMELVRRGARIEAGRPLPELLLTDGLGQPATIAAHETGRVILMVRMPASGDAPIEAVNRALALIGETDRASTVLLAVPKPEDPRLHDADRGAAFEPAPDQLVWSAHPAGTIDRAAVAGTARADLVAVVVDAGDVVTHVVRVGDDVALLAEALTPAPE